MYQELKDRGLEIVAVNAFDTPDVVKKYLADNQFTFKVVMGGQGEKYTLGKAYGVEAYPTNYLLDPQGKVVWRSIGFDEAGLRGALEKLGLK